MKRLFAALVLMGGVALNGCCDCHDVPPPTPPTQKTIDNSLPSSPNQCIVADFAIFDDKPRWTSYCYGVAGQLAREYIAEHPKEFKEPK